MNDLRERAIRGTLVRIAAQSANMALRVTSLAILARLLTPNDFGLVGMVAALTGILSLFRDFGLSAASIQHVNITKEQMSTLFWINVLVGAVLTAIAAGSAPFVAAFYREPRLYWVTIALASTFFINAIGIQHSALLQREMRFTTASIIDTGSTIVCASIAIAAAKAGWGYWSLVAMTVASPLTGTSALWVATRWIPGLPRRRADLGSMMRFGSTLTATGVVLYVASNSEKALLGRYWGADAIGVYGRAFQLIRIPTDTLTGAVGEVAFSALSRLQDDAKRLRSYFLKGYSLVLALTIPSTIACAVLAPDLIDFVLGPKWKEATAIFRLLTPTILVFAIANPLSWLVLAIGMVAKSAKMTLTIAPFMIGSYFVGLPYGPKGVAFAYSAVMLLWLVPVVLWSVQDTAISFRDVLRTASYPLISSLAAGSVALGICSLFSQGHSHLTRLIVGGTTLTITYLITIFYVMGQKSYYLDILRKLIRRSAVEHEVLVPAE